MAGQSAPQVKAVIANVVNQNTGPEVTPAEGDKIAAKTLKAMASNSVVANATNQEPLWQSGVVWGGSTGVLVSLATILIQVGKNGTELSQYDLEVLMPALGTLWTSAYTLYRRLMPGLKPLFSGWFGSAV